MLLQHIITLIFSFYFFSRSSFFIFFFFNDTATTEIYTLSLHDALPILHGLRQTGAARAGRVHAARGRASRVVVSPARSEEHTSELQSHVNLVCRLLLEKKKIQCITTQFIYKFHFNLYYNLLLILYFNIF